MREFTLALFLLSGVLKAQLLILAPWVPDVTLISIGLLLISLCFRNWGKAPQISLLQLFAAALFFAFITSVLISALYSPSSLILLKIGKATLVVFAFLIAMTTGDISWPRFAKSYVLLTFLVSVMFVYIFPQYRLGLLGEEASFYSGSYLSFGDACAVSLVLLFYFESSKSVLVRFLLAAFFLFCMVLSGARAPLLFLLLLSCLWLVYASTKWAITAPLVERGSFATILAFLPLALLIFFYAVDFNALGDTNVLKTMGYSIDRFLLLVGDDKGGSVNVRVNHLSQSLKSLDVNSFFGVGFGAYGLSVLGNDRWDYPHNMFLEVWVESGLLPFFLLLSFVSTVLSRLALVSKQPWLAFIIIYCVLNAMKSSSYADNRVLFFWLGVAIVVGVSRVQCRTLD